MTFQPCGKHLIAGEWVASDASFASSLGNTDPDLPILSGFSLTLFPVQESSTGIVVK